MNILLIKDDAETQAYITRELTKLGHVFERAMDGREGLQLASSQEHDVLDIDRMLRFERGWAAPGRSGDHC